MINLLKIRVYSFRYTHSSTVNLTLIGSTYTIADELTRSRGAELTNPHCRGTVLPFLPCYPRAVHKSLAARQTYYPLFNSHDLVVGIPNTFGPGYTYYNAYFNLSRKLSMAQPRFKRKYV